MGNFEKLSVLVIVVIIVMILVIAIHTWQDTDDATTEKPLDKREFIVADKDDEEGGAWPDRAADIWDEDNKADEEPVKDPEPILPQPPEPGPGADDPAPPVTPVVVPPPPAPDVPSGDDKPWVYTIQAGDTISQIAERELGTFKRQKDIFDLNPGLDPRSIRAGDKLKMPPRGRSSSLKENVGSQPISTPSGAAKPVPGEWYTLRRGDRMSTVAKRAYGSIERWPELWARNLSVVKDPDAVQEGTRIFIPK